MLGNGVNTGERAGSLLMCREKVRSKVGDRALMDSLLSLNLIYFALQARFSLSHLLLPSHFLN